MSKHIKNVFEEGELKPEATVAKFATVQTEGGREVSREIEFNNLLKQGVNQSVAAKGLHRAQK